MPYIDKNITEGNLLNEMAEIFVEEGWTMERYFKKSAFSASRINPQGSNIPSSTIEFHVAEHMILKHPNPDKNIYYGMAIYGKFDTKLGMLKRELWPIENVKPPYNDPEMPDVQIYESQDGYQELADFVTNKFPAVKETHTIYFYMLDAITDEITHNGDIMIAWNGDLKQAVLDIEVQKTAYWVVGGSPQFRVTEAFPDYRQSPISAASLRIPALEKFDSKLSFLTPHSATNWFADSLINVQGVINEDYAFLILVGDASASYENNGVPSIPLFMGKFISEDPEDKWNYALATGSAFKTNTPEFDFDDPKPMLAPLQPLLKDYVNTPANAIDNVMVYRGKMGSFYQAHHLFVDVPSNIMPPILTHKDRDYPRAWKQAESAVYDYQYNPSRYTGEVSSSYAQIEHNDEGVRGRFPDIIVTLPLNLNDGDGLKVRVQTCPDEHDEYKYHLIEGVSPFTKIPATPYRQLGVGIMYKKFEGEEGT